MEVNIIHNSDCLEALKEMPDNSVDCIIVCMVKSLYECN